MIDLTPAGTPLATPREYWNSLDDATRGLDAPLGVVAREALAHNAHDLLRRAEGLPIRVASKSIRIRGVLDAVLALPGYRGILAYTLAEALWLAQWHSDIVVGYPTASRASIARLAGSEELAARVAIMVDDVAQLDLIDAVVAPDRRPELRVALELDASWDGPLGHIGVRRSPLHTPAQLRALAEAVAARPGFRVVGVMAYEAQIAGVGNAHSPVIRWMQKRSATELAERRAAAIASVREVAELEFVNGGGTGSVESKHADSSVTEVAAGSGLLGPHLFDNYRHFRPAPAAAFALDVVRHPAENIATVLGGGWIASGPAGADRLPQPVWPTDAAYLSREGAGEVQTPLVNEYDALQIGDRVWFRHTKAGELAEHLNSVYLNSGGAVVDELPTYRGEGKAFL